MPCMVDKLLMDNTINTSSITMNLHESSTLKRFSAAYTILLLLSTVIQLLDSKDPMLILIIHKL